MVAAHIREHNLWVTVWLLLICAIFFHNVKGVMLANDLDALGGHHSSLAPLRIRGRLRQGL
jgi:hypothetical protein